MCGISGFFHRGSPRFDLVSVIDNLNRSVRHRGPDFSGNLVLDLGALGHQRLSILDLSSSGNQPFFSPGTRTFLTFNGEIFNYRTLRNTFFFFFIEKSDSDTEVLYKLLNIIGVEKTLSHIQGMFAFGFYDESNSTLTLARDPLGKKPLYYTHNNEFFAFSSEPQGLSDLLKTNLPDPNGLYSYLNLGYIVDEFTLDKEIKKLLPGHFLEFDLKSWSSKRTQFFDLKTTFNRKNNVEDLYPILQRAVDQRLEADVPICSLLSSGVDSRVVTLMANLNRSIRCFSVGFKGNNVFDESTQIQNFLKKRNLPGEIEAFKARFLAESFHPSFAIDPIADTSYLPTYQIMNAIKGKFKIALSGDGADELFCGYSTYVASRFFSNLKINSSSVSLILRLLSFFPSSNGAVDLWTKLSFFLRALDTSTKIRHVFWRQIFRPEEIFSTEIWRKLNLESVVPEGYLHFMDSLSKESMHIPEVKINSFLDQKTWLPYNILVKSDRASMINGIELRSPFLDDNVMLFANSLSANETYPKVDQKNKVYDLGFRLGISSSEMTKKKGFNAPYPKSRPKLNVFQNYALDVINSVYG